MSASNLFLWPDLPGADPHGTHLVLTNLSGAHLLGTDLSETELVGANLDGSNAGVAARAGRISPGAPAGHRLQLPLGEFADFSERRGTGEHQVDGVCALLHHPYLSALGQPGSELLLHGPLGSSSSLCLKDSSSRLLSMSLRSICFRPASSLMRSPFPLSWSAEPANSVACSPRDIRREG